MTRTTEPQRDELRRPHRPKGPIIAAIGPTGGESVLRMARALAALHSAETLVLSVVTPPAAYAIDFAPPMLTTWPLQERRSERLQTLRNRLHKVGQWSPWLDEPDVTFLAD